MSHIFFSSPKHCANHHHQGLKNFTFKNKKLFFALFTSLLAFILLIYITLRPSKPHFSLQQAELSDLGLTSDSPFLLNSSIQLTLRSKNPNTRVGIYYDELHPYALYKGQLITEESSIPPFYQGTAESNILSASLAGSRLPMDPTFGFEVGRDRTAGKLVMSIKVIGRIRWKVGTWVSGRDRINIDCIAIVFIGADDLVKGPFSTRQGSHCSVNL